MTSATFIKKAAEVLLYAVGVLAGLAACEGYRVNYSAASLVSMTS